jgi:putative membrane protein
MNFLTRIVLAGTASLLVPAPAIAQNGSNMSMNVPASDQQFMQKAAQGGMAEVQLGQLAQQNAQSPEVKAFGERMVRDHSKANDELKQLASQQGVTLPSAPDEKDQATAQRLSQLHGAAFDKAYMQDMVQDHHKDIADFKKETSAKDPQLRQWVVKTLPVLESHLREAEKVAPTVGVQAMGSTNTMSESMPMQH